MAKPNSIHREHESAQGRLLNWQTPGVVESKSEIGHNTVTREVEFAVLPDGRMLDLAADPRQPTKLSFLVWEDGTVRRASHIEHEGELLVPPKMDPSLVSALRLPNETRSCPEAQELFTLIMDKIGTYVDVTSDGRFLATALVLMTWFADRIAIVPYMWIGGPTESGKTTLMRVLHCLCRRAIHASAITAASIYRMGQIRPTLLIDEAEFAKDRASRDLQRLLRGGNRQGSRVLCNGMAFENFGPKVIASRVPSGDAAFLSRNIFVSMMPSTLDLSFGPEEEREVAETLQPMLQSFRFSHYAKISPSQDPRFSSLPPRLRDSARALAAPMLGNKQLEEQLVDALKSQIGSTLLDRLSEPEWVTLLAVFALSHQARYDLYVADVSEEANRIFRQNGETRPYSARMIGEILNKSLGFHTRRRGEGYRIALSSAVQRQIHSRARAMGLKRADIMPAINAQSGFINQPCSLCAEFGLMTDHENRRLLTLDEWELEPMSTQCTNCGAPVRSSDARCPICDTPKAAAERSRDPLSSGSK